MSDIFKDMQANVGCEYISDLPSYKRKVWHEMKRLNPADYEERQLEDFSKYVFGMSYLSVSNHRCEGAAWLSSARAEIGRASCRERVFRAV